MQIFEPIKFTSPYFTNPYFFNFLTNLDFCSEYVYNGEMS